MGAARNLEQDQAAFDDKQLSSLDKISNVSSSEVLDKAVEINIIDEATKEAIKKAMPGHEAIFQKALEKAGTGPAAFKRAFRSVYGRFLLEREPNQSPSSGRLTEKLKSVLKFEIDEHGFKGRPELQVAARRLRDYVNSRKSASAQKVAEIPGLEKKVESFEKKKSVLDRYLKEMNDVGEFADSIENDADNYGRLAALRQELTDLDTLEERLNEAERRIRIDAFSSQSLNYFFNKFPVSLFSLTENKFRSLENSTITDQVFARKLLGIDATAALTTEGVETNYQNQISNFLPEINANSSKFTEEELQQANDMFLKLINAAKAHLDEEILFGNTGPINNAFADRDRLETDLRNRDARRGAIKGEISVIESPLEGFRDGIMVLLKNPNISSRTGAICELYIRKYNYLCRNSVPSNPQVIKDFIRDEVKPLVAELKVSLASDTKSTSDEISELNAKINEYGKERTRPAITGAEAEREDIKRKQEWLSSNSTTITNDLNNIASSCAQPLEEFVSSYSEYAGVDVEKQKASSYINEKIAEFKTELEKTNNEISELKIDKISKYGVIKIDGISEEELFAFLSSMGVNPKNELLLTYGKKDPLDVFSLSIEKLNKICERVQEDQLFARKVFGLIASDHFSKEDLDRGEKRLRGIFHPDRFNQDPENREKATAISKMIGMARKTLNKGKVGPITDHFSEYESVKDKITNKKDAAVAIQAKLLELETQKNAYLSEEVKEKKDIQDAKFASVKNIFDSFRDRLNEVKSSPGASTNIKKLCDKYVAAYETWTKKGGKDSASVKEFYKNTVCKFVPTVSALFASESQSFENQVNSLNGKISGLQNDILPNDLLDGILAKAFPSAASGGEIKRLERKHHEAEHDEHHLQDIYKYFSSPENIKKVSTSYHDLKSLVDGFKIDKEGSKLDNDQNSLNRVISKLNQTIRGKTVERDSLAKASANKNTKEGVATENNGLITSISEEISKAEEKSEQLNEIRTVAKSWKTDLSKLVESLEGAHHAGIHVDFRGNKLEEIAAKLKAINPSSGSFNPSSLVEVYDMFGGFFENHHHEVDGLLEKFDEASATKSKAVKDTKKDIDKANAAAEKEKNLTDDQAAKRIIGAIIAEQFPDLSAMEHNKLVSMILADDVATLQTDEGYEALAQRGSAENLKVVGAASRAKLISFKFKEGEKVTQPFKGLKPDDFKDWASVEKLFLRGKLNYKNAFFVLAAFEDFDNGVKSIQAVQLEKKLKKLLAKELGVDEHMDKAGLSKIVDDAFKAQMEKVRPLMKAHNDLVQDKGGEAKSNKKKVLDMRYEELNDQLRTKKIGREIYENKLKALVKEATEADVEVEFSVDSTAAQFWNSPQAQWLRDKAHDTGVLIGKKTLAAAVFAPAKILGKGAWGATKLGASLGFQGALLPVRAAKYPLLLAAKPLVGLVNLFRSNKWTPLPGIRASLNNDVGRVMGYAKEKATGTVKGAAETVTKTTSAEWDKVKYTDTKYEDRRKHHNDERAELLKIHEPKSELDAIDVAESPFISFDKYKKQVEMVATALGIKINAPSGHEVKVGHEETAKKEEAPHAAPAHGAEAKKEEPAHGADAHAHHEEPKKAAGGHH